MIAATLIPDSALEVYDETPEQRFLRVARIARASFESAFRESDGDAVYSPAEWRSQYIHEVAAVAAALNIPGIPDPNQSEATPSGIAKFDAALARVLTKIRFSQSLPERHDSVGLTPVTKQTISNDLEKLRELINRSNLSPKLKDSLHQKIDAVEAELGKPRSRLSPFWLLHGAVAMLNFGVTGISALADAKPATEYVQSITHSVRQDKAAEQAEEERLTETQKLIGHEPQRALEDRSSH